MLPKRPRIHGFPYTGFHRYSLTICTKDRREIFIDGDVVAAVLLTIQQSAAVNDFAVFGYCFMPDHVHIVVTATSRKCQLAKVRLEVETTLRLSHKQQTGESLWQPSYFDHVLRDDEETWRAVRYVFENPVRKGLVHNFCDYPFSGSDVFSMEQLKEMWQDRQG